MVGEISPADDRTIPNNPELDALEEAALAERKRRTMQVTTSSYSVQSPMGRIASALSTVEDAILQRDVALRSGETTDSVANIESAAAQTACIVLDEAVEYLDHQLAMLQNEIVASPSPLLSAHQEARNWIAGDPSTGVPDFVSVESQLLQLAGISETLAARHVRGAISAFESDDWTYDLSHHTYHQAVMLRISRGRDAVCGYADVLLERKDASVKTRRSRERMKLASRVLGGVLITGTNVTAGLILGPLAAAASTVIGSAAATVLDFGTDKGPAAG